MADKIKLNHGDLRKILQTEGLNAVEKVAEQILGIVGEEHYEMDTYVGAERGRASVFTRFDSFESMGHEAKHHNLIRALGQVRG